MLVVAFLPEDIYFVEKVKAMRADIVPGGVFPDYELPDHTNTVRKLSSIQGRDPMILTLARGHF